MAQTVIYEVIVPSPNGNADGVRYLVEGNSDPKVFRRFLSGRGLGNDGTDLGNVTFKPIAFKSLAEFANEYPRKKK